MTAALAMSPAFRQLTGAEATRVAATLGALVSPSGEPVAAPTWLHPEQIRPFRQAVASLRRHGAAFLALPVGTGKSFIALAAAQALGHPAVDVVGPAALAPQWMALGARLGTAVTFTSENLISRGHGVPGSGLVIIDESHHFRHPATRRYRNLLPLVAERSVILLSATPVVNRPADLAAQLALAYRDDALAPAGLPSLAEALSGRFLPAVIGSILIGGASPAGLPTRRVVTVADWGEDDPRLSAVLDRLDRLKLSRDGPIGALIRTSLLRALASSPAALLASIRRYRRLLDHAARARQAGHPIHRATLRGVIDPAPDQLVMWEVLDPGRIASDLALVDRSVLGRLDAQVVSWLRDGDAKTAMLRTIVADRRPTVVFAASVPTVHHLRRAIGGAGVAWLTGDGAGVGGTRFPRGVVLEWFGPSRRDHPAVPWLLLASDVAAEGLDLQGAGRVVHFDIPWTAVRLEQRDGRIVRLGSSHREAEIIRFPVPARIERRLGLDAAVEHKGRLGGALRRRIDRGAAPAGNGCEEDGWAVFESLGTATDDGFVAGVSLERGGQPAGSWVVAHSARTGWTDDPVPIARLIGAMQQPAAGRDWTVEPALALLEAQVSRRLRHLNGSLLARRPLGMARSARRTGTAEGFITARLRAVGMFGPASQSTSLPA